MKILSEKALIHCTGAIVVGSRQNFTRLAFFEIFYFFERKFLLIIVKFNILLIIVVTILKNMTTTDF